MNRSGMFLQPGFLLPSQPLWTPTLSLVLFLEPNYIYMLIAFAQISLFL